MTEAALHINAQELLAALYRIKALARDRSTLYIWAPHRQCNYSCLHKLPGWNKVSDLSSDRDRALAVVSGSGDNHNSPLPTRSAEYPGRLHVQTPHRLLGLDAQPVPISGPAESAVGSIRCRPVCNQVNEATTDLLQLETRSRVSRGGCIGPGLESAEWVRTPSMVPDRSDTPEGDSPRGYSDPDCTSLAEPTVVSNFVVSASGPPPTPSPGPSDPLALTELQE